MRRSSLLLPSAHPRVTGTRARRGSILILVAILTGVLLGVAAFAVDFGRMYLDRAQVHVSADAAALAGADRLVHLAPTRAVDSAVAYGVLNLVENRAPTVSSADIVPGRWDFDTRTFTTTGSWTSTNTNAVRATSRFTAEYLFGRVFGFSSRLRSATSIAAVGSVSGSSCVRPLAVPYQLLLDARYGAGVKNALTYVLTEDDVSWFSAHHVPILLKSGNSNNNIISGNFYGARMPPVVYADGTAGNPWSGASNFEQALGSDCASLAQQIANAHGRPYISVGDWLQPENGNMVTSAGDGLASLCSANGGTVPANAKGNKSFTCVNPTEVRIAMWSEYGSPPGGQGCGGKCFKVMGIGVFYVTGFEKGNGAYGYFSSIVASGPFSPHPGLLRKTALVQ